MNGLCNQPVEAEWVSGTTWSKNEKNASQKVSWTHEGEGQTPRLLQGEFYMVNSNTDQNSNSLDTMRL